MLWALPLAEPAPPARAAELAAMFRGGVSLTDAALRGRLSTLEPFPSGLAYRLEPAKQFLW